MSRSQAMSVALKAVLAAVAVGLVVIVATLDTGGCAVDSLFTDLGSVTALCRAPSDCYLAGADCSCARGSAAGVVDATALCRVPVDPTTFVCTGNTHCKLPGTQCVGRAPQTCPGVGARCLPIGSVCSTVGGNPPDRVGTGPNDTLENRCTYVDDVCCPGSTVEVDAGDNADAGS